ncbi:MAG: sensor histidine kinase [Anaerocolumna sp.]
MERNIAVLINNDSRIVYLDKKIVLDSVIDIINDNWREVNDNFRIKDKDNHQYLIKGTNKYVAFDQTRLSTNSISYIIHSQNNQYYLQMAGLLTVDDEEIIIEILTNVTDIFVTRKIQQKYFINIVIIVGLLCAFFNMIHISWIGREIKKVTDIVIKMQQGDLSARVNTSSTDELGKLSEHFNHLVEKLESNMYELKEAARKQEEFVGSFTHEIRTPLTSMIGYADLLRRKQLDDDSFFIATNHIYSEGKRLEELSTKLLGLLVEKSAVPETSRISLKQLVIESIDIIKPSLDHKDIQIDLNIEEIVVDVDISMMKTVIINIIDNARKAINSNGLILIAGSMVQGNVELIIIDNGNGIPSTEIPKITEAFYRVDKSRSRKEGGAGLGLTICSHIMNAHEGELLFESELGTGTKVTLLWKGDCNQ